MRHEILTLALVLLSATLVNAAVHTIHPDGSGEYATIQDALDVAADFDTLRLGSGVFSGPGNRELLIVQDHLLIESTGSDPSACVINPEGLAFGEINRPVHFRGVGFRGGSAFHSTLPETIEFENCVFEDCAGIAELHTIRMTDCAVSGSTGPTTIHGWRIELTNCLFEWNNADLIFGRIVLVSNCEFSNNSAPIAMIEMNVNAGEIGWGEIDACRFTENAVEYCLLLQGDGFWVDVTHCIFDYNTKTCIYSIDMHGPSMSVESSTFVGNGSYGGADLLVLSSTIVAERCIFVYRSGGQVADNALVSWPGSVSSTDCDVFGNIGGDWTALLAGQFATGCNMSEAPLLCDMLHGDFKLYDNSPCLAQNNACAVPIGAEGQGCMDVTAVDAAPRAPATLSAYPNPFNPATRLRFEQLGAGPVTLTIHDAAGRRVATLLDREVRGAGEQFIDWRAEGLPSGVYVARLEYGGIVVGRKLVLLR